MHPESLDVLSEVDMPVTVSIPTPLRSFTGGHDAVELAGSTVAEVLDGLLSAHVGLKRHLIQDDGRLRNFVNLYLNDTDIRQPHPPLPR